MQHLCLHYIKNKNNFTTYEFCFSHLHSQNVNLQSQNESTSSESIPSERESAVPPPDNNTNNSKSNYSSDNNGSDLDGECPAEPINTGFSNPGVIKDDLESMTTLAMKICTLGSITANHFMAICAKFVRYIMVVHRVQQIRIVEPGPINQSPSMTMLVKSYGATIPQKVINNPFLVWQISASKIPLVYGQKRKAKSDMKPTICALEN